MLLYVPSGAFSAFSNAFSVSSCVSSTSIGLVTRGTAGFEASEGCKVAPVTLISKDNTDTPVGGLSRIDKLSDRGANGWVGCVEPPQPATSTATERTAEDRNASFLIGLVPFRNLSPRLDLRTDLVSKITIPHGRRHAKMTKIALRAVIRPPMMSPTPGPSTQVKQGAHQTNK